MTRAMFYVKRSLELLRPVWLDMLAIVWPCACVSCGLPDREFCDECARALRWQEGRAQLTRSPSGDEVWVCGRYEATLRAVLVACKHGGRYRFVSALGALLSGPLDAAISQGSGTRPVIILTAPSRPARVRERGFRHLDVIARCALADLRARGMATGRRAVLTQHALRALPGRTGQVGLDQGQRAQNASLIYVPNRVKSKLEGREVVLVDDIVTTGATIRAAVETLTAAGATVVGIATLAVARRRDSMSEPNTA